MQFKNLRSNHGIELLLGSIKQKHSIVKTIVHNVPHLKYFQPVSKGTSHFIDNTFTAQSNLFIDNSRFEFLILTASYVQEISHGKYIFYKY